MSCFWLPVCDRGASALTNSSHLYTLIELLILLQIKSAHQAHIYVLYKYLAACSLFHIGPKTWLCLQEASRTFSGFSYSHWYYMCGHDFTDPEARFSRWIKLPVASECCFLNCTTKRFRVECQSMHDGHGLQEVSCWGNLRLSISWAHWSCFLSFVLCSNHCW